MDLAYFCCTLLLLFLVGFGSSDLAADIQDCGDKLVGLAGCRPYVGGDAKVPSIDCCSGLKVVLEQSKKCLCILIKDRDDPDLGFKMNATLAVHLPSACHAPANITQCVVFGFFQIFCIYHLSLRKRRCLRDFKAPLKQTVPPLFQKVVLIRDHQVVQLLKIRAMGWERGCWWQRWLLLFYHLFSCPTFSS